MQFGDNVSDLVSGQRNDDINGLAVLDIEPAHARVGHAHSIRVALAKSNVYCTNGCCILKH